MTNKFSFVVGGTLSPDHPTYVKRQADTQLLEVCLHHEYAYVLTTRQVGKSSLMVSTAKTLQERNVSVVQIDLSGSFGRNATMEEWYFTFVDDVIEQLELSQEVDDDIEQWWASQHPLPTLKRFERFWRDLVLPHRSEVVIFIDEIDYMLNYEFKNDFFAGLRFLYNQRKTVPIYKQLTFVLLGTARPETLSDAKNTPFNIGEWIVVDDLQLEHCEPFWQALNEKHPHQGRILFEDIYDWTAGHPYLTQKLSQAVFEAPNEQTTTLVERLVDQLFIHNHISDHNLNFVQNNIISHSLSQEMLQEYNELLKHEFMPDKGTPASNYLQLYGLIKKDDNKLWIRNNIYKKVFNQGWVAEHLRQREQERYVELQQNLEREQLETKRLQQQVATNKTEREALIERYSSSLWVMVVFLAFIVVGSIALALGGWSDIAVVGLLGIWGITFIFVLWYTSQLKIADSTSSQPDSTTIPLSPSERVSLDH
ncbi:AAA-like domain-containing protein [Anaerolineales bacterium HSG25]|nr:AAA-like domain-containing protein [Anaerolineales bacterium HSG25]